MSKTNEQGFKKFLQHTNEKEILLKTLANYIKVWNVQSLLDIGAGDGLLAIPLSKHIPEYTALEAKPSFAKTLREAGLSVIEEYFPTAIQKTFDMVLLSHVVSYEETEYTAWINQAFKLLNPGGHLVIIIFRGHDDDWNRLATKINETEDDRNRQGFQAITSLIQSLGPTTKEIITTSVETTTLEDMLEVLSFVFGDSKEERKKLFADKRKTITDILEKHYQHNNKYIFPFQHFVLATQKANNY